MDLDGFLQVHCPTGPKQVEAGALRRESQLAAGVECLMVLSLIQIYWYTIYLYQNDHSTGYVYDSVCLFYFACILGLRKLTYSLEYSMLPKEHAFITGIPFWEVRVRADSSCYVGVCTFVVVYVCRYMYIWALIYIYTHVFPVYLMNTWRMPLHMAD